MKKQPSSLSKTEVQVLHIIKEFLSELESERALPPISLEAKFLDDLRIGSLERAELFNRIEKAFVIQLPDNLIAQAERIADLIPAIEEANPPGRMHYSQFFPPLEESKVDPSSCKTLVDIIRHYAELEPQRIHIYLQDELGKEKIIRYGALYEKAIKVAQGLQHLGLNPDETVAIMLPTCEGFFYSFLGILLAGGVPVPIYPPFNIDRIEEYAKRESKILRSAEVRILISFPEVEILNKIIRNFIPSLKAIMTVEKLLKVDHPLVEVHTKPSDSALIQYTSGSTGDPKGVLLTHSNLLANIRAIGESIQIKPTDVAVSWLPLYHDMGLIGAWLGSLYYGVPLTVMSPLSFLTHPERWLWAIHYHRATLTAGPNFAYELCVSKIDDSAIEGLDLSSLRLAFNGAEAVYPKTLRNFIRRFGPYGLRTESIYPVYGLAESSVALTFPPLNRQVRIDKISRTRFNKEQKATPCQANEKNCIEFVSCGMPLPGHEVKIVTPDGKEAPERVIGKLYFRGPSAMQGYYRNQKSTNAIKHEGWWESGDLAYKVDGEIFITGRQKDIIVKAGRNLYPQEIEEIAGLVPGIRRGCVVAFGVTNAKTGTEQLVVVAETRERRLSVQDQHVNEIIEAVTSAVGEPPDRVIIVPPKTIPKTSSGKLQRSATKELFLQGKLSKRSTPPWLQFLRLFSLSTTKKINTVVGKIGRYIYSSYVYTIITITILPMWLMLWILPQRKARNLIRFWARNFLRIIFCPVEIKKEQPIQEGKIVYVANHMSYLDTVLLAGYLPDNVLFVGKKELSTTPIIKNFIDKLGHLTVERMDFIESMSDTNFILNKFQEGNSIMLFPEGTFSAQPGLRPFKLGAFKIASETGSPICPISISGTRKIQRGSSLLLKPHSIQLWIGRLILPRSKDWREATRLRTVTRIEIAKHCGENMLDTVSGGPATQ